MSHTSGRVRRGLLAAAASAMVIVGLPLLAGAPAAAVPAVDGNPDLASGCGLDVTLVLDDSASISSTEATQAREAAQLFADALVGTPSQLKTVVFDTRARGVAADGSLTSNLSSVVFRDPAAYTAPTSGAGQGGTNWDDGLEVARRSTGGPGDLVVFITDGDPTYRNSTTPDGHANDGSHAISGDGSTIGVAANLANPVAEAGLIKAGGTHLFGIGVGLAQNSTSEQRLNGVTGDEELSLSASGSVPPFGEGDYAITPNFAQLKTVVADFSRELCGHTVNVTKFLQKADGTTVQASQATPWEFTLTLDPAPGQWNNPPGVVGPTASLTTDANGGVSFVLDQATPPDDHLGDIVETPQAGWDYNGAVCTVNDFSGSNPTELFDSVGANAPGSIGDPSELLDLPVTKAKALNCSVYNRERRPATIQVAKATVPAGEPGDFDFTLSSGQSTVDTLTGLSHGDTQTFDAVPEGTYTVTEAPAPGFINTSATCDDLATQQVETVSAASLTVTEGQNWRCRFVNDAQSGTITVVKDADGADGTFAFTSNVPDLGDFSLTTASGTATTSAVTVPVGTYAIAETVPAGWTLTGATCTGGDSPASVTLSAAENVVCTFTNVAPDPSIVVTKSAGTSAVGEPGGPVTYTVGVANTSVEPLTVGSIVDSIDGGPDLDLTTVGGPITATTCDTLVGSVLAAGAPASTCTFVAEVSGNGGDTVTDEVTVVAVDSDDNEATGSDGASVDVTDVAPTVALTKTPSVSSIPEPGGAVTYTLEVTNTGVEPLRIDALTDSIEGGAPIPVTAVAGIVTATTCGSLLGATVAPNASASCAYTIAHIVDASDYGDGLLNDVARVDASDDDGEVFATAAAEVAVTDVEPTISVTKTADPVSIAETAPGATTPVSYTVQITNSSPEPVAIDSIVDAVDGGAAQAVAGTCDDLLGSSLAAGASTSCTFSLPVSGEAGDSVTDVVTVEASDNDGNDTSGQDDAAVAITDVASSIEVTKVATTPSVPEPGGPATFLVTIANTSTTDDVTIASVVDSVDGAPGVPAGGSCPDLVGDVLVPGQTTQCTFTLQVTGNAGESVPDTVTVSGTDDDGGSVSDSADAAVRISDVASSLAVTKVADVTSVPEPGGPVTFTVTVTNTSPVDTVTLASVVDSVDGAPAVAAGGSCPDLVGDQLVPGGQASCTFTLPVTGDPGDVVPDTVTVTGIDDDQLPVSADADESVAITGVGSSIAVTKVASVDSVPEPGGPVTFTVTIENTSTVDAATIDAINDSVDGGAPFAAGGDCPALIGDVLPVGGDATCSFTLDVDGDPGDVVADTVTVQATDDDGDAVSDQAEESVAVTGVASSLVVTKTADVASVPEPGGPVTYTVTVANTSPVDEVTIDEITDSVDGDAPFPAPGTCPDLLGDTLAAGASTSCQFTLLVLGQAGDAVGDTVVVSATDDDDDPLSGQDSESVDITDTDSSLQITKVADVDSVPEPGGPATYTVTITNSSTADDITIDSITDSVDGAAPFAVGGDCIDLLGDVLAPGASASCSFVLPVLGEPGDTVSDTVTVTGTDDDGGPVSDQASEAVDVADVPSSITVAKVADVASLPEPGGPVTYTVTVTNSSDTDDVTIDSVTDSVDGGAPFAAGGDCPGLVGDVLAPGASTSCSFTLPVTGQPGDVVADTVTVTGTDDDGGPVSAQGSESVAITDVLPSLTVTKTASPSSVLETAAGQTRTVTFTVGIQNDAAEALTLLGIVDAVDGGPAVAVGGTCDGLVGSTLAAQDGTSCEFTMAVSGNAGDTTTDVVTVSATDDEQNAISAADDATVTFTDDPSSLLVEKVADVGSVPEPGGPVTYTVTVTNASVVDAVKLESITDSVDGGPPFAPGGDCQPLVGTSLDPGASSTCSFTLDVTGNAGDTVTDTVTVSGTDDDGDPVSASGSESVAVTDVASALTVTKEANVAAVPEPGGPVTYAVTVTNASPVDDITIDSITDSVSGGAPFAAGGDCPDLVGDVLAPGASVSCAFTLDVSGQPGDVVPDTVTVTGTDEDRQPVSGQGSETVDIVDVGSALLVTKDADVATVPEPGGPVTFTVGVTNLSAVDTVTISSITDSVSGGAPFPAGGTCPDLVETELAPGASTSCAFTLDVAGNAGDVVTDTVTVTGEDGDPEPVPGAPTETAAKSGLNDTDPEPEPTPEPTAPEEGPARTVSAQASASVTIGGMAPTATLDKVANPKTVPEFGGPVSYGITVTNTSPSETVTLTSLTDAVNGSTLDATAVSGPITATTCALGGQIAPGASYQCAFTYAIGAGQPGDTVVDTATAVLVDDDGETVSPSDTETVTLTDVAPSISVVKDNGDAVLPAPGGEVDFNVGVANSSAEAVTITSITDAIDGASPFSVTAVAAPVVATTCAVGVSIPAGGTYSCTFRLLVSSDEAATFVDEVVVQVADDDQSVAQASDTAVTTITASADVSITKRLAGPELEAGEDSSYELVVANAGPSKAADLQVVDTLPEGLTALAATGDGWTCGVQPATVTCTRPELAAGESSTITISVRVAADAGGRSITNVADVASSTDDPDLDNNHAEVTDEIGNVAPEEEENPQPTPGPGEPPAVAPSDQGTALPRTGSDTAPLVRQGLLLLALGGLLLVARRFLARRPLHT